MNSTIDTLDTFSGGFATSAVSGCPVAPQPLRRIIYLAPGSATGPHVFVTESGAIGMEAHGRIAIKTIESWIAMAWNDIPSVPLPLRVDRP